MEWEWKNQNKERKWNYTINVKFNDKIRKMTESNTQHTTQAQQKTHQPSKYTK